MKDYLKELALLFYKKGYNYYEDISNDPLIIKYSSSEKEECYNYLKEISIIGVSNFKIINNI